MNPLIQQAKDYAKCIMSSVPYVHNKDTITDLIAGAYEQGWIDRDTRDIKFETEKEFFE